MLIIMTCSQLLIFSLCCLPMAASLRCYTCVFPAISQMDCLKFPQECPAGQRCLASTAVGTRGSLTLKLYEKSCAISSHCGMSGQKEAAGFNFNYSNVCCDTDLCNGAVHVAAPCWKDVVLLLLPVFYVITVLK